MIVYGIPNCNTIKKAIDWLKAKEISFDFHDFKKKGITEEKLNEWFSVFGWEKVINKNGLTFKKLSADERLLINSPERAVEYLIANTSAIKRPVIEKNGLPITIGFDEKTYETQVKI
ncbi:MAG: Spx/MgsR family RNA polymerase-binding regulatory protein [Pedobacter sp.]|nr:MAG: Spx/MgsR family RNA polymerase-binding regulatory protein [Pedobacter sp.]